MNQHATSRTLSLHHLSLAAAIALWGGPGCGGEPDLRVGCAEQAIIVHNALTFNAMTANGAPIHGLALQDLQLEGGDCTTAPQTLQLAEYTVGCALEPDQEVVVEVAGEPHRLRGQLGLAPEWATEPCDEACQGWVSACLIARINARGERVEFSMRGDHEALVADRAETAAFPVAEAAYYGSLFTDPMELNACLAPGNSELDRVCGEHDDCPVQIAGACHGVCDETGCLDAAGERHAQVVHVFRDAL